MPKKISLELKYHLYEESVQSHESDIDFVNQEFKRLKGRHPFTFREDFGGTALMACDWVRQSSKHRAWAIDLDREPQNYGREHHYKRLGEHEQKRMTYIQGNVLDTYGFKADVVVAFNFSYFVFKKRRELVDYFKKVYTGLEEDGMFVVDIFGGTECFQELEEETEHDGHNYIWDCDRYNPITSEILYYIHFKDKKNNVMYRKAFTYDWRHWNIREVIEAMEEASFSGVRAYWEEDDGQGEGNGEFYESTKEENCESWVAYIVGLK